MIDDQKHALSQIINYVRQHKPDAVVIAGDVYDKLTPPPEDVSAFDIFLTSLASTGAAVMIVSGNHDSPERLGFASGIMDMGGVHIYGVFDGSMRKIVLFDEYGEVRFYMLPYIRPADVRRFYGQDNRRDIDAGNDCGDTEAGEGVTTRGVESYQDAVAAVIGAAEIDVSARNVLVAHQFFTMGGDNPERSESERIMIGGIDMVDAAACGIDVLFDYTALGHLHGPQRVGADKIRYSGSPLKYSFSEYRHDKCALLVELRGKGELTVGLLPIIPLHDMRRVRGRLDELLAAGADGAGGAAGAGGTGGTGGANGMGGAAGAADAAGTGGTGDTDGNIYNDANNSCANYDYLHVTLTDEEEIFDAQVKLSPVYPNIMKIVYDNARSNAEYDFGQDTETADISPLALFEEFFIAQNGTELNDWQRKAVVDFLNMP